MSQICNTNHTCRNVVRTIVVVLACAPVGRSIGEDAKAVPSWRKGVSRWNGSGYELPKSIEMPASKDEIAPALPAIDSLPYTIPEDPSKSPQRNPYAMPLLDPAELKLTSPLDPTDNSTTDNSLTTSAPSFQLPVDSIPAPREIPPIDRSDKNGSDKNESDKNLSNKNQSYKDGGSTKTIQQPANDKKDPSASAEILPPPLADPPLADPPLAEQNESDVEPPQEKANPSSDTAASKSITEVIGDAAAASEPGPLQEEVIRWYHYPRRWMRGWNSHAEFGLDGSDGNANTLALQTGLEMKRKTDKHTLAIDVDYRQATNRRSTTEDNGRFNVDYDRLLNNSPWAGFGKFGLEWDRFKAFDLRVNVNGGLAYHWIRRDDATFVTRFGAGASQEIGAPDDSWLAEAVFGIEAERQLTERQKLKGRVDYFPAWEDFGNYRLVSDLAWEILLDGSENLSLRLAATDRYDSTPQGARPNDVYYSMLLLYKF